METGQHGLKPIPPNQFRPPYDNYVPNKPIYPEAVTSALLPELQSGLPPGDPQRPQAPLHTVATTKRITRASLACDSCRQLKAKCDEKVPCGKCQEKGTGCTYRDTPLKPDSVKVLEKLEAIEARLSNIEKQGSPSGFVRSVEKLIARDNVPGCNQSSHCMPLKEFPTPYEESNLGTPVSVGQTREVLQENMQEAPAYEFPISLHHTVLEWPSIRKLMQDSSSQVDYESVLPQRDADEAIRQSVASPASSIDGWSQASILTPPPSNDWHGGNLNAKQDPRRNPRTVRRYVQSFKDNVLNLYPVISPTELDDMTAAFLRTEIGAASPLEARTAGQKRKRYTSTPILNHGCLLRTEEDALILLVLALGQLCLRQGEISNVAGDSEARSRNRFQPAPNSPTSPEEDRNGGTHASASRQSSLVGAVIMRESPCPHLEVPNLGGLVDLDYFALAMDTGQMDGHCQHQHERVCNHVCIHILAGLYYAILGRLPESWSYVFLASRKIQAVVERSLCRITDSTKCGSYTGESTEDNQLIFDFWICLGLESNILIILSLPPSGLRQYEAQMPSAPNLILATNQGAPEHAMQCYAAQLYLRSQLVLVHDPLKYTKCTNIKDAITELQNPLKDTRDRWVPRGSQWKDDDPPPNDAPSADLRSKYWLSQVVLYLPFLKAVLEEPSPPYAWSSFNSNENKTNPSTISNAESAIKALIESTQVFRGLEKHHSIIFGLPWINQTQYENLMVLTACHKNNILCRFINQKTLRRLFTWAILSFKRVAHPTSTLKAAMSNLMRLAGDLGFMHGDG